MSIALVTPTECVAPGCTISVGLLALNSGVLSVDFAPPPSLLGRVLLGERSWPVELRLTSGGATTLGPGRFANRSYSLTLPPDVTGSLILEVSQGLPNEARAVMRVGLQASEAAATPEPPHERRMLVSTLQRSFAEHFSVLDPTYFIYGPKAPGAKFQFSFKYRVLSLDGDPNEAAQQTVQFGYTQRSLWDINASSSPFYDTSYMPSLFYQFLTPEGTSGASPGGLRWLGFRSGYQHESNGQGSVESRSLNTLFVRSGVLLGRPEKWHAIMQVRVSDYVGGLSDNPDLKAYRGYGDWQVIMALGNGPSLSYSGWAGNDLRHLTSEFDMNFPIKVRFVDFATYFLIQYFKGYGESLRDYDKPADTVRAGFSLVR
ncbi:MAG: phospholipase A [Opitutaceae bacterium]